MAHCAGGYGVERDGNGNVMADAVSELVAGIRNLCEAVIKSEGRDDSDEVRRDLAKNSLR